MNIIERQTELGKSLYEINTSTLKEYFSISAAAGEVRRNVSASSATKLPELRHLSAMELKNTTNFVGSHKVIFRSSI